MPYTSGNFYLTMEQMQENALYLWGVLQPLGWSLNAVAGMLGNMQEESSINPGIWQGLHEGNLDGGYGIVQWTPATKFLDWAAANGLNPTTMESNLARIEWEIENGVQWRATSTYNFSFSTFKTSTLAPYTLALAFVANYERPKNPYQPERGEKANYWYEFLSGQPAPTPPAKKLKIWMYIKRKELYM